MELIFALAAAAALSSVMAAAVFWFGWTLVFLCRALVRQNQSL